ncbi:MAG TPA: type II secretion system F family protein [Aliidongia sp.]|nr:type II secretion system F family protein [Aliidongia sp.]
MPSFRYVAIDSAGQVQRGFMDAADQASVIERLQRQGHIPMRAEPAGKAGFLDSLLSAEFGRRRGLTRQEVANATRELAIMLGAGQDLDRALRFLVDTAPNKRVAKIMGEVRDKVRGGTSLAVALSQQPQSFNRLYVGLVRAGEAGGTLGDTLDRLAVLLERERSLAATIQSAMLYPALLMVTAVGSVGFLLTYVLPQFVPMFAESGAELPTLTRIVIALGDFVSHYGLWTLLALIVIGVAIRQLLQDPARRLPFDALLLRMPIVGGLMRETLAARFSRTLGTLLKNGVPLITALGIVKEAIGNLAAVRAVETATESAKGGAGLSRPLAQAGIFPIRTIHLLRLGEETAQLGQMSLRAAEIHEEQSRLIVQRLVSLLVPVITIAMGMAVAAIVGSLLLAMLSLNDLAS